MEQLANFLATTTLNMPGNLTSSATTITPTAKTNFPSTFPFRIRIDSELIKVTANSGSDWTVVRADGGTTGAAHSNGATINAVLTKEALDAIVTIQAAGTEVASRRVLNFLGGTVADDAANGRINITPSGGAVYDTGANRPAFGSAGKIFVPSDGLIPQIDTGSAWMGFALGAGLLTIPPVISNWTWVNQGTATGTDIPGGGIYLLAPAASGDNNRMLVRTLSPPYTITAGFLTISGTVGFVRTGIVIYDTVSGKLIEFCMGNGAIKVTHYNSTTSFNTDAFTLNNLGFFPNIVWMQITDNSTTRAYKISPDGLNWLQLFSHASGTFVSPNRVGIDANSNNTTWPSWMTLVSWKEA